MLQRMRSVKKRTPLLPIVVAVVILCQLAVLYYLHDNAPVHLFQKDCMCDPADLKYHDHADKVPTNYVDTFNCSSEHGPVPFMEAGDDWRPVTERYNGQWKRIGLCFVFGGLLDYGGIESWFWSLFDTVFNKDPFFVYGVSILGPRAAHPLLKLGKLGIFVNPSAYDMTTNCDVILQTGSKPIKSSGRARDILRVLIIHGGAGCKWTEAYALHAAHYHQIVTVSPNGRETLPKDQRHRALVIPAGIPNCKSVHVTPASVLRAQWNVPDGKKVLMFLGRIGRDKDPQFFVDVVHHLPDGWVGVMVGPMIDAVVTESWNSPRILRVGRFPRSGDAMQVADVLLNPAPSEGGPLVLLEAWGARKPMFMRHTGWAVEHPTALFLIGAGDTPTTIADRVVEVAGSLGEGGTVAEISTGFEAFSNHFSLAVVARQWAEKLTGWLDEREHKAKKVELPLDFNFDPSSGYDETTLKGKCLGVYEASPLSDGSVPLFHYSFGVHLTGLVDLLPNKFSGFEVTIDYGVEFAKHSLPGDFQVRRLSTVISDNHTIVWDPVASRSYFQRATIFVSDTRVVDTHRPTASQKKKGYSLSVSLVEGTIICIQSVTVSLREPHLRPCKPIIKDRPPPPLIQAD